MEMAPDRVIIYSVAPDKKRTVNFTSDERRILTELVLKYHNIVENKRTDATTNKEKWKGWQRLAVEFNNISTDCYRSHTMLKCCWENIKRQKNKNRAEYKKNRFMTEMASNRKRTVNFTSKEKRILSELVFKYRDIVESKRTDGPTNKAKWEGWKRLAVEFNNISTDCSRSHTTLKCCWENIKRQRKKNRAEFTKNIFMTGRGEKLPTPSSNGESSSVVGAILHQGLEGNYNICDSDAEIGAYCVSEDNMEDCTTSDSTGMFTENEERPDITFVAVGDDGSCGDDVETKKTSSEEDHFVASTPKETKTITLEDDRWTSGTPKDLKTPVSSALKVTKNNDDRLTRRQPKYDNASDILIKEKIELVRILKENALKESRIKIRILEEQLKQEILKTEKLTNN